MNHRPLGLKFSKFNAIRSIFWIKFARFLNLYDLVVSIDETSINGSIHGAFGWGPKGGTREVASLSFEGRLSLISAIFSDGNWILKKSRCNTNSNIFIEFADEVRKLIKSKEYYKDKNIILLIDNASYHKTKSVVEKLSWFYHLMLFIPPYSPQFNPIKLFFAALNAKIKGLRVEGTLKLSTEDGIQRIEDTINQTYSSVIVRWFLKTFKIIRLFISNSHI